MNTPLLFLDLETTGLDPATDHVLEVGAVAVHPNLDIAQTFHLVVQFPRTQFTIASTVLKMHTRNGLLAECLLADNPIDVVDDELAGFISRLQQPGKVFHKPYETEADCRPSDVIRPVLAGSSPHFDRAFMRQHLPKAHDLLHYRNFDLSTLRMFYGIKKDDQPTCDHRSLADINYDLNTLRTLHQQLPPPS